MPKVKWEAKDADNALTAQDVLDAEESGFTPYTGDLPRGGVYRFRLKRIKKVDFESGNMGFNNLMELDGSWKPEHAPFDGCPLWDRVTFTKSAAGFVKAFAAAIGVSAQEILGQVVTNEDGYVTKIGKKSFDPSGEKSVLVYVNVKRGSYKDEPRLEAAGTGYLVLPEQDGTPSAADAEPEGKKGKAKKAKKGKGDEAPF